MALLCVALAGDASPAFAQSRFPLQIDIEHAANVSRTSGPIRLQLNLDWGGPGVFHGTLLLEARDSDRALLGTFVVDNLYLTEGRQLQEVMLPGFRVGISAIDSAITLKPTLVEADTNQRSRLRDLQIIAPANYRRELVVAILAPEEKLQSRSGNDLADTLKLEKAAPPTLDGVKMLTKSIGWRAEDAPQEPLRYCACDILLLPSAGLKMLDEPQLDALLAWVRAGGAVCVLPEGEGHTPSQVAWLNALAGATEDDPVFLRDSDGRLIHELSESSETSLRRLAGLGRAVVVVGPDQPHPRAPHWRNTGAFLWRLKDVHLSDVDARGSWNVDYTIRAAEKYLQHAAYGYNSIDEAKQAQAANFQPLPPLSLTDLILQLLPDGVRLVPLSTMGLLLLGYLIAIGPLDYFVLGRLKMRRWTWCTFPAMTLLFTGVSIWMSNRYMSANEMRRSAVIRDFASDGALVRENRLELLFPSSSQVVTTDVGRGLCMPTRYQDFAQLQHAYNNPYANQYASAGRTQPAAYHGRIPTQCRLVQTVPQWTPQLNRSLTIPLAQPDDLPEFDWTKTPDFTSEAGVQRLRKRIQQAFEIDLTDQLRSGFSDVVTAGLFHLEETRPLLGDSSLIQMPRGEQREVNTRFGTQWIHQTETYLQQISVATQPGFQGLVSQYAPTGGDRIEDLMLLDPTDRRQWLLVIVQPRGSDIHIYRRLYVLDD